MGLWPCLSTAGPADLPGGAPWRVGGAWRPACAQRLVLRAAHWRSRRLSVPLLSAGSLRDWWGGRCLFPKENQHWPWVAGLLVCAAARLERCGWQEPETAPLLATCPATVGRVLWPSGKGAALEDV